MEADFRNPSAEPVLVRPADPPTAVSPAAPQADNVWRIDFQLG